MVNVTSRLIIEEIERNEEKHASDTTELYDVDLIKKSLDEMLTLTSGTIEKEVIDRFVYQIVQQSDDHFLWFLNLQPGKKQTLIAKVKGRKGKGVVELTSGDESMSNNPVFNLENKKDDPKEVETSLESSIYTYKSIDFNQFIVNVFGQYLLFITAALTLISTSLLLMRS